MSPVCGLVVVCRLGCSGDDNGLAAQCDTGPAQFVESGARAVGGNADGVVEQDRTRTVKPARTPSSAVALTQ
jgi:hypothetical protein